MCRMPLGMGLDAGGLVLRLVYIYQRHMGKIVGRSASTLRVWILPGLQEDIHTWLVLATIWIGGMETSWSGRGSNVSDFFLSLI